MEEAEIQMKHLNAELKCWLDAFRKSVASICLWSPSRVPKPHLDLTFRWDLTLPAGQRASIPDTVLILSLKQSP